MGIRSGSRVLVGMSGGIDSSMTAALLVKQGFTVTGVAMWLGNVGREGCCSPAQEQGIESARKVADKLGIPFHVIELEGVFNDTVISYFRHEYRAGRTPNPCVRCNQFVKFGSTWEHAVSMGIDCDYFATGHYARIEKKTRGGRYCLRKGMDTGKDQSYFLYGLSQEQLGRTVFPLGDYLKTDVRRLCAGLGLGLEERKESQDFMAGDYKSLFPDQPGLIVDRKGKQLGWHRGITKFTVGQRRGIGVSGMPPLYVLEIQPESNIVVVGEKRELLVSGQRVRALNWVSVAGIDGPMEVRARIRSSHAGYDAVIRPVAEDMVEVAYCSEQEMAAPGQSVVFYQDDMVLGGGIAT